MEQVKERKEVCMNAKDDTKETQKHTKICVKNVKKNKKWKKNVQ